MTDSIHKGACLCESVSFEITGEMRPVVACHCGQCRKTSGHFWAATQVNNSQLKLNRDQTLKWYRSSDTAQRGFCNACGSSLFWKRAGDDKTSIGAGTLDKTGLDTAKHIFTSDKGDYYDLGDGVLNL